MSHVGSRLSESRIQRPAMQWAIDQSSRNLWVSSGPETFTRSKTELEEVSRWNGISQHAAGTGLAHNPPCCMGGPQTRDSFIRTGGFHGAFVSGGIMSSRVPTKLTRDRGGGRHKNVCLKASSNDAPVAAAKGPETLQRLSTVGRSTDE